MGEVMDTLLHGQAVKEGSPLVHGFHDVLKNESSGLSECEDCFYIPIREEGSSK